MFTLRVWRLSVNKIPFNASELLHEHSMFSIRRALKCLQELPYNSFTSVDRGFRDSGAAGLSWCIISNFVSGSLTFTAVECVPGRASQIDEGYSANFIGTKVSELAVSRFVVRSQYLVFAASPYRRLGFCGDLGHSSRFSSIVLYTSSQTSASRD